MQEALCSPVLDEARSGLQVRTMKGRACRAASSEGFQNATSFHVTRPERGMRTMLLLILWRV